MHPSRLLIPRLQSSNIATVTQTVKSALRSCLCFGKASRMRQLNGHNLGLWGGPNSELAEYTHPPEERRGKKKNSHINIEFSIEGRNKNTKNKRGIILENISHVATGGE